MLVAAMLMAHGSDDSVAWGLEALETLKKEFGVSGVPGYAEQSIDGKTNGVLFNWGVGVLLSAMNAAARHDPKWKTELARFVTATHAYWNPLGPVAGYDVLPGPKPVDRYYDDNAWMAIALLEAYDVLKDPKLLKWAEEAVRYVLSGEDHILDGGIYWRESDKKSKNTCSNAPAVVACLELHLRNGDPTLPLAAERLYHWTRKNLQDPKDKLYWDSIDLDGKLDKTKWSYNSALMIRAGVLLARKRGNDDFLKEAEETAKASEAKWIVDGKLADAGRFAHLLVESWTTLPSDARREKARAALRWLAVNGKNERGLYGGNFFEAPKKDLTRFELIDQASAARAFLVFR